MLSRQSQTPIARATKGAVAMIVSPTTPRKQAVDGGMPELGLGDAEAMVVRSAWKRHFAHFENAKRFRKHSLLCQAFLIPVDGVSKPLAVNRRSVFFNVSTMFLATLTTLASAHRPLTFVAFAYLS